MISLLLRTFSLALFCVALSGCATLMNATNSGPIKPDPGRRSFGAYLDDERLESIIAVNLDKHSRVLADARIHVRVFNGVVLLTGEVPNVAAKQAAGENVRSISKVRQVHNELAVKSRSTLFSRLNDDWIAVKVRAKLLFNRDIEAERVKVVVENRVVFLMGLLTRSEADLVSDIAARVGGVEKVVRVIEYISPQS